MKKIYLFMVAMCLVMTAQAEVIDNINYELYDNGEGDRKAWVIANDPVYSGDIVIPDEVVVDGVHYPVIGIWGSAFAFCDDLTSISLPEGLEVIGSDAFWNCTALTEIILPSTLERIDNWAFESCSGLTSLIIPDNVNEIGYNAFYGCTGLKEPVRSSKVLYQMIPDYEGAYAVPEGIEKISANAFENLSGLTALTLPNSLRVIEEYAFSSTGISTLDIPASVEEIRDGAFCNCWNLTNVNFAAPATSLAIYYRAFESCHLLEVTLPEGVQSVQLDAFGNNSSLKSIHFPASASMIEPMTFCPALEIITVAEGSPYYHSHNNCNAVIDYDRLVFGCKTTTIPNDIKYIGHNAFKGNGFMYSTLPAHVTELGEWSLAYCDNLTSFTLPNTVESVSSGALYNPTVTNPIYNDKWFCHLPLEYDQEYTVPDGIEYIAGHAFYDCKLVPKINLPASLKEIGDEAFYIAESLTEITVPDNVEAIRAYAFDACDKLRTIRLPKNLKEVSGSIFYELDNLEAIYNPQETPLDLEGNPWLNWDRAQEEVTLYVPDGSVEAYANHEYWGLFTVKSEKEAGLEEIMANDAMKGKTRKVLHNGDLYILQNNKAFNIEGKRIK